MASAFDSAASFARVPALMAILEFFFLGLVALFVIVNPLSAVPLFLAMTPHDTPEERVRMARFACFLSAIILTAFAFFGQIFFSFLGITMPAFKIAGGLLLAVIAFDMLRAPSAEARLTP